MLVYERGGKVWIGEDQTGLVFLEKDWDGGTLPQDLIGEAGVLSGEVSLLTPEERMRIAGYRKKKNHIQFLLDTQILPIPELKDKKLFLASEINGWEKAIGDSYWQMERDGHFFSLTKEWLLFEKAGVLEFKFVTEDGMWLHPPDEFPFVSQNKTGAWNYIFDSRRTGKDILRFQFTLQKSLPSARTWERFRPTGKLGYIPGTDSARFRVFAPRAEKVELLLPTSDTKEKRISMNKENDGCWSCEVDNEAEGKPYLFGITHPGTGEKPSFEKKILDPYARACLGRNGPGLALTPLDEIETRKIFQPPEMKDLVIAEAHLRDLLAKAPIELDPPERLEFRGLSRWLKSKDCYLRKLGVNAVELQPVVEFDAKNKEEYHWGYMPVNFFSPASVYGSNQETGNSIPEFKELINSFHEANISVILDVVYNHVGIPPHLLNLDRNLHFRTDEFGRLQNHSGCGNDLKCEAEPVKKLILDSLIYFVKTFDIDGFRFDLGELIGIELLREIEAELKEIKPGIILITEPWSFRGRLPLEINQTGYAQWSDNCREKILDFILGRGHKADAIALLQGSLDKTNRFFWQSVNYLESHDDYTLIDRLCELMNPEENGISTDTIKRAKLGIVLLLLSPGVPMIAAGQDLLHHKQGVRNTYLRSDLNELNYDACETKETFSEEIRNLIRLRLSEKGALFRPSSPKERDCSELFQDEGDCLGIRISTNSEDQIFYLFLNAGNQEKKDMIPLDILAGANILSGNQEAMQTGNLTALDYVLFEASA